MIVGKNMYRQDVLRQLMGFVQAYKKEIDEYYAVGVPEERLENAEKQRMEEKLEQESNLHMMVQQIQDRLYVLFLKGVMPIES